MTEITIEEENSRAPAFDDNAMEILKYRYLRKDKDGKIIENPIDLFIRVAKHVSQNEDDPTWFIKFYKMMRNLEFIPASPILFNSGGKGQMASCFVLQIKDDMKSIFNTLYKMALIQKSGGGTGYSFSNIRETGAPVSDNYGVASGAISFMGLFNDATKIVKQGGKRMGANMGVLSVDHPEIEQFIWCKNGNDDFSNFNISVSIPDWFMDAVEQDDDYNLRYFRGRLEGKLSASEVFEQIARSAWGSGEPGILFIDKINDGHPIDKEVEATNPCGEAPLLPYESCVLGSINLAEFVNEDGLINYERLEEVVHLAVRFLDNVIDVNHYLFPEIKKATQATRKIGLGVMGYADMLVKMGISYKSDGAVQCAKTVMRCIDNAARAASVILAAERGVFPAATSMKKGFPRDVRNAVRTTIAPTGSISNIAMVNGGIEPFFAIAYQRMLGDGRKLTYVNPLFEQIAIDRGFWSEKMIENVCKAGSLKGVRGIPSDIRKLFVTAHEVSPEQHVRILAAFQEFTDNAVSKTINLPHEATVDDVKRCIKLAYDLECKGLTLYRDGSRRVQVLTAGTKDTGESCSLQGGCDRCD